ncbi:MAG: serine protein kinase PrkA [Ignavibacteria bacterium]|jgi:serine protein kinase|nr:serine protein kinase PrkA [Ignavibacteria bacterium]MCU7500662.1 serine protein kinase PrkA [Ignavibacteria bacterium]MCU7512812.1 serine protein kinase PrkA [Ignavibacteria bacterium]MCU7521777.1 serine protein kinase PrkA [Ignavibacteria bacterium]MCU7524826.1 serine protein kinase PrkA [Ignavibacteria bacterium]
MRAHVQSLDLYLDELKRGQHRFENVFESIARMLFDDPKHIQPIVVNGKNTYDFMKFRTGKKHIIGMFDVLNKFVAFIKDAAEDGESKEMAFVLAGEPGNGKTYFVDYLSAMYRDFVSIPENNRYTFRFKIPKDMEGYGNLHTIESQTYEDPMILAMNLFTCKDDNKETLLSRGFTTAEVEDFYRNYRPLGADSEFILNDLKTYFDEDLDRVKECIDIVKVPISETMGTITGKYPAKDKITSSGVDLVGEESIQRLLHITNTNNPYRFDLRRGALARVGGGGIHFADEIFKNKTDLMKIYLGVVQNRVIEIDAFKWPIDTFIIATSNNADVQNYRANGEEKPIIDRCKFCYVAHNTDYKLQQQLTKYALGSSEKTTFSGEKLHMDPNLIYVMSTGVTLSRLPRAEDKLTPVEMMKLAAGEVAGEKSIKALAEIVEELEHESDITKRFGQKGLGQRDLARIINTQRGYSETNEGRCMFGEDAFKATEEVILDYIQDTNERQKYFEDLKIARGLYRKRIRTEMFNAFMDEPAAIKKDVLMYVNMIVGMGRSDLGSDKIITYRDPQTNKMQPIKIDERFVNAVENELEMKTREQKESFRGQIRKIYAQRLQTDKNYDFMDNVDLVKAVTDTRLNSDIASAGGLVGALANRTNEDNERLYNRIVTTMTNKLGYCHTCAQKTIEFFCTQDHQT